MRKALLPIVVLPLMLSCRCPRHVDFETGEPAAAGRQDAAQATTPPRPCAPEPKEWSAAWIVEPQADAPRPNSWYCFRTRVTLGDKPHLAYAHIAADSKYWLWINGRLIVFEGALKRGPTPHDTYYDEIPLRDHLVRGENTIAVLLWYFGKDGFSHKSSGIPGLLFQAEIDDTTLVSDRTWRAMRHPSYSDTDPPHPNYRLSESNVRFDARADMPLWTGSDFDDSAWPHAAEAGRPPTPPWNLLIPRPTPLWEFSEIRDYVNEDSFPQYSNGTRIIANLPHNMAVTPYLKVQAREGQIIGIRTDNYGRHDRSFNIRAEYVTRPGLQQYEALAYMTGHEVYYDIPPGVEILRLGYRETSFATEFTGSFACDDSFCTALWRKAANTLRVSMRDCIQDPDRERAQWWGDAVTILGQIFYCCDVNAHALVRKAMLNLVDWRRPDGVLYSPVPSGSWNKEVPCQMLAAVGTHGFWTYYMATGDDETILYVYPHVRDYLNLWKIGADDLLVSRAGDWDWVDWGDNQDRDMIEAAWYCMALESAEKMAAVWGDTADARAFSRRRARLMGGVNRRWWRGRSGYRSSRLISEADDRANGLAVVAGIADRSTWDSLRGLLARLSYASPYMEKYVLEALFVMGDASGGLARMKRRYTGMVESDLTTLWEHWYRVGGSYNHGWAGGPLTVLSQYVLGVAPLEPGYGRYRLMPQMGPLCSVDATVPTVKGPIVVQLERGDSSFVLRLHSPPGTTAVVGIPRHPTLSWERITVNRHHVWGPGGYHGHLKGVELDTPSPTHIFFRVAPGEWELEAFP